MSLLILACDTAGLADAVTAAEALAPARKPGNRILGAWLHPRAADFEPGELEGRAARGASGRRIAFRLGTTFSLWGVWSIQRLACGDGELVPVHSQRRALFDALVRRLPGHGKPGRFHPAFLRGDPAADVARDLRWFRTRCAFRLGPTLVLPSERMFPTERAGSGPGSSPTAP